MSLETMTKLASTTVGVGGSATIEFTGIPQNYTDLKLVVSSRTNRAQYQDGIYVYFNNSTTNYSWRTLIGDGTAASVYTTTNNLWAEAPSASMTANVFGSIEMYIPNYAGNSYKTASIESMDEGNQATVYSYITSALWSDSSPITSVKLIPQLGTAFVQYSTFTLYGIKNARQTAGNSIKATGGNIVFDGTYVYHVFNSTGAFVPNQPISADILAVAGGGGNGRYAGGGGGAGGVIYFANKALPSTSYAVTVGAGGAQSPSDGGDSSDGTNSIFGSFTAAIGGGGGGGNSAGGSQRAGHAGGSGGGGGGSSGTSGGASTQTGPDATAFYGNAGRTGLAYTGAGGGGAGGLAPVPQTNTNNTGNGGVGITHDILNSLKIGELSSGSYYVGGGGYGFVGGSATIGRGGIGGGGGGPSLSDTQVAANGIPYTGGGGGTSGTGTYFGNGGSGIVIIRYKG